MDKADYPLVDVLKLRPLEGHKLWLRFTNGREGVHDHSDFVRHGGPMVEPLRDEAYFARVFIESGAPTWPNGFDLDPIKLYMDMRDANILSPTGAHAAE